MSNLFCSHNLFQSTRSQCGVFFKNLQLAIIMGSGKIDDITQWQLFHRIVINAFQTLPGNNFSSGTVKLLTHKFVKNVRCFEWNKYYHNKKYWNFWERKHSLFLTVVASSCPISIQGVTFQMTSCKQTHCLAWRRA